MRLKIGISHTNLLNSIAIAFVLFFFYLSRQRAEDDFIESNIRPFVNRIRTNQR